MSRAQVAVSELQVYEVVKSYLLVPDVKTGFATCRRLPVIVPSALMMSQYTANTLMEWIRLKLCLSSLKLKKDSLRTLVAASRLRSLT